MGVELELYILLAILLLGSSILAVFEVETARWRKVTKLVILSGGTVGLYYAVGHLALVFLWASLLLARDSISGGAENTASIQSTQHRDASTMS